MLVASLEKNSQLVKDIFKIKEDLNHSFIWTYSSNIPSNLANKKFNNKNGLGSGHIETLLNSHYKYVYVNILCTHCGRNGYLKEKCETLKGVKQRQEIFLKSSKGYVQKKKEPGLRYHFIKIFFPYGYEGLSLILFIVSEKLHPK